MTLTGGFVSASHLLHQCDRRPTRASRNGHACGTVAGPKELVPDFKLSKSDRVGQFSPSGHSKHTAVVKLSLEKKPAHKKT